MTISGASLKRSGPSGIGQFLERMIEETSKISEGLKACAVEVPKRKATESRTRERKEALEQEKEDVIFESKRSIIRTVS